MNLQINMEAFRNGDKKELENIVKMFNRRLFFFCRKLVDDDKEAEDIAIESLGKALLRCKDFETPENLKAFLYITARNACYNKNRNNKRRIIREQITNQLHTGLEKIKRLLADRNNHSR